MRRTPSRLIRWVSVVGVVVVLAVVTIWVLGWVSLGEALVLLSVAALGAVVSILANSERRFRAGLLPHFTHIMVKRGITDYEQLVAWAELERHLSPAAFMPPLRGWAASPDVLRILIKAIDAGKPDLVVECGSGSSTVWLGYALRRAGRGRLVALEHDARYAELSRALVTSHGLNDVVEVRLTPLIDQPVGGARQRWYDTTALDDLDGIGVLFVDGPPGETGPSARYPAIPLLLGRCRSDVTIVLDDAARPDEHAAGDRWLAEHPRLQRRSEPAEKGADVFTLR